MAQPKPRTRTSFLSDKILGLKTGLWLVLILVFSGAGIYYAVSQPAHASWRYGACKILLEQYVRFPTTIDIEQGGETRGSAFISFADVNPFGSRTVRNFECYYSQDKRGNTVLSRVTIDRKSINEDVLKIFQRELPVLTAQKLDTALPKDLPASLEDYKD